MDKPEIPANLRELTQPQIIALHHRYEEWLRICELRQENYYYATVNSEDNIFVLSEHNNLTQIVIDAIEVKDRIRAAITTPTVG